jgi:MFS transporter, FHS family, glucose/mannose:H+ symporter
MAIPDAATSSTSARALTLAAYISFVPIGIATVLLGPMLPTLSARWSLNYAQAGALFNAQYAASTCGVAVSGWMASRWGFRTAIKVGLVLMSAALALLLAGPMVMGIACIAGSGAGMGLAVPAANLLVADANPGRRSATLNLLNVCWSVGAVACPFLVATAVKSSHIQLFLISVAVFSLLIALGIALMPASIVEPVVTSHKAPVFPLIRSKLLAFVILGALFLLYVGVENAFGQWMATYAKSLGTLTLAVALATPSLFYAALTVGRWLAPLLLRLAGEVTLVRLGLLLSCAGMAGLVFSSGFAGVMASACAAGFGLSYVYPITIALLSKEFGSARIGSFMFVLSNIGGGILPWIVGVCSTRFETLKAGLLVPLIGCAAMFALYLGTWTRISVEQPESLG